MFERAGHFAGRRVRTNQSVLNSAMVAHDYFESWYRVFSFETRIGVNAA